MIVGGVELVAFCHQHIALFNEQLFRNPLRKNEAAQGVDIVGKGIGRSGDHDGSFADLRRSFSQNC